jgi:ABC-type cobalamin/Fe3+-siderophores transport system ATPase subunit
MKENSKKKIKIGYVPQSINVERHMPTTVYDMFASYISDVPVCFKKDKKIYDEIKEHLKLFGAEKLIDKGIGNLSGAKSITCNCDKTITKFINIRRTCVWYRCKWNKRFLRNNK